MRHRIRLLAFVPLLALVGVLVATETPSAGLGQICAQEFSDGITGDPGGLAIEPGGRRIWFTEQPQDRLGAIDVQTKQSVEYPLPPGTQPHFIAAMPDGRLWFTGLGGVIGNIDPHTGAATIIRKGISPGAIPHYLLSGPDGNIYFSEETTGRLGEYNTRTHTITEISAGLHPGNRMHGLGVTPDGNIWAAMGGTNELGRFNIRTRRFDQFIELPKQSVPHDLIVVSPPAQPQKTKLYATLSGSGQLAEYTFAKHKLRLYDMGEPRIASAAGIDLLPQNKLVTLLAAPDGKIWLTTFTGDKLIVFDPRTHKHVNVTCGITPHSANILVIEGPDRHVWFSEPLGMRIGRIL